MSRSFRIATSLLALISVRRACASLARLTSQKRKLNFLPRCNVIGFAENKKLPRLFATVFCGSGGRRRTKVLRPCLLPLASHVSARPRDSRDSLFTALERVTVGAVGRFDELTNFSIHGYGRG